MIAGESVTVQLRQFGARDAFGNETVSYSDAVTVDNVLVVPGNDVDDSGNGRPFAIRTEIAFCFPRGWTDDLRGAKICRTSTGRTYQVVGDPEPLTEANLPPDIPWNVKAGAVRLDG